MSEINKTQLKAYAADARTSFTAAVKTKAAKYGLSEKHIPTASVNGQVLLLDGVSHPASLYTAYQKVVAKINAIGFEEAMNEIAYTWFNRMIALRYMELNNLLPHGYKVIGDDRPEILQHANHVDISGLNKDKVTDLLLAGNKDEELYAYLLSQQLAELNKSMPFLFEKLDDETNLLMPDNLLATDSVRAEMVKLDKDNFNNVEVIGWLYQFYISEKKDALMKAGKAYKKEEIPAVTQLFTPNWIVKYMVQNSLGAKWLETYPNSSIKSKMAYYIEPVKQDDDVQKQLDKLKDSTINPEEIKIIDPACGSGHILVEAYDLLKDIYLDRGYNKRDIPALIIKNNLYGIDIDLRASQLAAFALAMKAVADNPRLLNLEILPNIICMNEANSIKKEELAKFILQDSKIDLDEADVIALLDNFEDAKTYGSLIKIKENVAFCLEKLNELCEEAILSGNNFRQIYGYELKPFVQMAKFLSTKYDCVIANPPYMGNGKYNTTLKKFAVGQYPNSKVDLCTMFMELAINLLKLNGCYAMINQQAWMFLSSSEKLRVNLLEQHTISSMAHMGFGAFGADFGTTAFVVKNPLINKYNAIYLSLREARSLLDKKDLFLSKKHKFAITSDKFATIPGRPIAYWISEKILNIFVNNDPLGNYADVVTGMSTGNNDEYLRFWHEVDKTKSSYSIQSISEFEQKKLSWLPYNKGGDARKWAGNSEYIAKFSEKDNFHRPRPVFSDFYFKEGITWSFVTSGLFTARYYPLGRIWDVAGSPCIIKNNEDIYFYLSYLSTPIARSILKIMNPTLNCQVVDIQRIPSKLFKSEAIRKNGKSCKDISQNDWDSFETSWDFENLPMLNYGISLYSGLVDYPDTRGLRIKREGNWLKEDNAPMSALIKTSYKMWREQNAKDVAETLRLEEENNRLFIDAYDLADEITPEVPIEQITLTVNPRYRYKSKDATDAELEERFKQDSIKELVSYAIGCMMGRYSLDVKGLVYANEGNVDFDHSKYTTFSADDDGVIPVMDTAWFGSQDLVNRFADFIKTIWGEKTLDDNLTFIANALGKKANETPIEAIRSYICKEFYKDHVQTYKKRPIYWLFSSGKEKAFECLVYMHRYNEQTLARIRTQFVIPLMGKYATAIENVENSFNSDLSNAERKNLEKQQEKLIKQKQELSEFDDLINNAINNKITIDLDDGVKVNYAKFGNLVNEPKKIVGK